MKPRKTKDIEHTLLIKGFLEVKRSSDHKRFYLFYQGKKTSIHTYLSHSVKEYGDQLMSEIKKQLKFKDIIKVEDFFDCPFSYEDYISMLQEFNEL